MRKNFICGLDIGTSKICATCGMLEPSGKINILANHTVPAQGIRAGRVIDTQKAAACIRDVAKSLRRMSGIRIRRVYANMDSPDLRAKVCARKVSFPESTKIKKSHIEYLINSAISSNVSLDRKVIHTGERMFILDDQTRSIYPEGLNANEVKLNIVIVSALIPTINSFVKCIREAGLILEDIVPSGCAGALVLFRDSQQNTEKNSILIDAGAGLSKIALFKDKLIKDIAILPAGAQNITEDIAMKLKISLDCAEELKIRYGRVFSKDKHFQEKIIVKGKLTKKIVQPGRLYEIITSKVNCLLQEIKEALSGLNYKDEGVSEIIFTGGGAMLDGFLERAEKILGKKVKMGNLAALKDNLIQLQSALYATSIGLIQFGAKFRDKKNFHARKKNNPLHIFKRARELYREYF